MLWDGVHSPRFFRSVISATSIHQCKDTKVLSPSQQFSNCFNAYAKAINKAYGRTGSLFERPFGRIAVTSDAYFAQLVVYIHRNPEKHGLVDDFCDWPYSSYHALVSSKPTHLQRDDVLDWFGGLPGPARLHEQEVAEGKIAPLLLEDFD
jgi:putative transposase